MFAWAAVRSPPAAFRSQRSSPAPALVGFDAEVLLIGEIVSDVEPVTVSDHAFVVFIDVPIVLREGDVAGDGCRIAQDRREADTLNGG